MTRWFDAVLVGGRVRIESGEARAAYDAHVRDFGDGEELQIAVRKRPRRQGYSAMRYYRGVVIVDIATATGLVPTPKNCESIHDALAWMFLRIEDDPVFHTPRRRSTSKNDMSQAEMSTYIDQCIMYGETEIEGCRIRRPHEVNWESVPQETAA